MNFSVTEKAALRIEQIISGKKAETENVPFLRVEVLSGGCNGFQYTFKIDSTLHEEDITIQAGNFLVVTDPTSMTFLEGAELDFSDKLMGAHFSIRNPNASSSCGCGSSFSVD
ncbi:hypothetical protein JGUZn3_21750 [Entomobacter blattae]|uniref:Core domain-containing protein n=1 Tax=Entomobacter blattae TaxID=2762277 RepID=A0A7H1NUB7_9PROT|nr:hypothetical protein JGUZn3_21750 [Entomobacter blattae]